MTYSSFEQGMDDFWKGIRTCPFAPGTEKAADWWDGWEFAQDEWEDEQNKPDVYDTWEDR